MIVRARAIALEVPIRKAAPAWRVTGSSPARTSLPMLFVRIDTDDGLTGWGEAFAFNLRDATRLILHETILPRCVGCDAASIDAITEPLAREFRNSRPGPFTYAMSALDMALWDLAAKRAGVPLWALLGGDSQVAAIPAYASLVRFVDPALAARSAAAVAGRGYRSVKLHEATVEPVAAARAALGDDISLMVDASSAWSVAEALMIASRLDRLGLAWLEEPTWPPEDHDALAKMAASSMMAIAAGENALNIADFTRLAATEGVSVLQPSVAKIGGVTEMRNAIEVGRAAGKAVVPHVYYLGPGLLASLHLIAACAPEAAVEHAIFDIEADPYAGSADAVNGAIAVPEGPGLGHDPDPDFIARYTIDQ